MRLFAAFLTTVLAGVASANELPAEAPIQHYLRKVSINGEETRLRGNLTIDQAGQRIDLEIWHDPCGQVEPVAPGTIRCLAIPRMIKALSAPLETVGRSCGSVIFSGAVKSLVEGQEEIEITVVDHSTRTCKDLVESRMIVEATSFNPKMDEKPTQYRLLK